MKFALCSFGFVTQHYGNILLAKPYGFYVGVYSLKYSIDTLPFAEVNLISRLPGPCVVTAFSLVVVWLFMLIAIP